MAYKNTGNQGYMTFSGWSDWEDGKIIEITPAQDTIETIDTSVLTTTGPRTKKAADLAELGEVAVRFVFDGEVDAAHVLGLTGFLVLTWPKLTGTDYSAPYLQGTAIVTGFEAGPLTNDDQPTAIATFHFDGETGPAWVDHLVEEP